MPNITICSFLHGDYDFVLCLNIKKQASSLRLEAVCSPKYC